MSKLYSTLYKSVVRAVNDLVKDLQATAPDLQYHSWESRDDEDQLPRVPLIGVNGFNFHEKRTDFGMSSRPTASALCLSSSTRG